LFIDSNKSFYVSFFYNNKIRNNSKSYNNLFSLENIAFAIAKPWEDILCLWVLIPILLPW
jgi:hypothetical protein